MLRDRLPKTIDYALKWCKAKEYWLEHVYRNFIWIYSNNEERYKAAKLVLGIKKKKCNFDFHNTINWDDLTPAQKLYWVSVETWVTWFRENMLYVENTYNLSSNLTEREIIETIKINHLQDVVPTMQEKLATFLYNCISGN